MRNVKFNNSDLRKAKFKDAILSGADLAGATIDGADFTGANNAAVSSEAIGAVVDRTAGSAASEDIGPGSLFATGLVAGGTITGTIVAFLHWPDVPGQPSWLDPADWSAGLTGLLGTGGYQILGVALFAVMGIVLYRVARRSFSL